MTGPTIKHESSNCWLIKLGSLFALSVGVLLAPSAGAQCVPINAVAPANADAALFSIEGKVTADCRMARTVTANGASVVLPAGNCISSTATNAFFETSENVLLGVLHYIDRAAGTLSNTRVTVFAGEANAAFA